MKQTHHPKGAASSSLEKQSRALPRSAEPDGKRTKKLGDAIYESLRRDIVHGVLPPGESLDELALVDRFDSSRTPIREALNRLCVEGLVVQHRNRGAYVSEISVSSLSAFLESLHLIQRAITRLAAQRWTNAGLNALRAAALAYESLQGTEDPEIRLELDQAFHFRIAELARNEYLEPVYRQLLEHQLRIHLLVARSLDWHDPDLQGQLESSISEHRELVTAIANRDADRAELLAGEHIRLIRKRVTALTSSQIDMSVVGLP